MKVALIHDYLNQFGGAERVLEALLRLFPQADLYTLLHDKERTYGRFAHRNVWTSVLDLPFVRRAHRPFIPLMPLATTTLRLRERYDLVISDSAGYAKGIAVPQDTFHLSYTHTPLRYAWETHSYFNNRIFTRFFSPAFTYLRRWDYRAAQRPNILLANSEFIRDKVKRYYARDASVVYPPLASSFSYDPLYPRGDYFLAVGRLLHYKRFDLLIEAFRTLPYRLVIVGAGPELEKLKNQSAKNKIDVGFIEFVKDDKELVGWYRGARALLFPQEEDFGLVAAEAIACGTPVIAFKAGGAEEIVEDGVSGCFFEAQTPNAVREAIGAFLTRKFDRSLIAKRGGRFSFEAFTEGIEAHLPEHLRFLKA